MEWALSITIIKAEYNGYGAPGAVEAQRRRVKLITGSGRFCGRGWVGFCRQERGMWLCREGEWNEQKGREREIHKAHLRKVDQCVYEVFNFSSVYKEQWLL